MRQVAVWRRRFFFGPSEIPPYKAVRSVAPEWIRGDIYLLEIFGALIGMYSLYAFKMEGQALFAVDNQGALESLVRGSGSDSRSNVLIGLFWALSHSANVVPWFEYVRSAHNIADAPSRDVPSENVWMIPDPSSLSRDTNTITAAKEAAEKFRKKL